MKKIILLLAILLASPVYASKIQKQGVKNSADCVAGGATIANCLIDDTQIYDTANAQLLQQTIGGGEYDAGNSGSALTINFANGASQKVVLTANCTFTFTNQKPGIVYIIRLVQDATGSRTATFPASVRFPGGSAPTLTTTANKTDVLTMYSSPGIGSGARYLANVIPNYTE